MTQAILKRMDDAIVLPLPAEVLQALSVDAESPVEFEVCDGQLIVQAKSKLKIPTFTLDELLADYDQIPRDKQEDYEWLNSPPVGRELI